MRARKALAVILAAAQLCACAHVSEQATAKIQVDAVPERALAPMFRAEYVGSLKIRSLVYKPAVLPMGEFLKKLSQGHYKAAFRAARLKYSPSTIDDEGIRTLIRNRYVPVLIDVANTGTKPVQLKDVQLTLTDQTISASPVPDDELPKAFEKFNPKAAAANAYNTGAVIVGAAAFLAVVAACVYAQAKDSRGATPLALPEIPEDWAEAFDQDVYNSLHKTTTLDYSRLIWAPGLLEPGKSARGLLFFKVNRPDWSELRLAADLRAS